ncbi:MAG: NgoBV family restriction endonuclease [[Ruminococcus] lactaris]
MAEKVWEITRRMEDWPINLQIKDNVVHKNKTRNLVCGGYGKNRLYSF